MTDVVVPLAMLIVAVAFGLGSHMHLGFPPEFAAAIGLALFCIMLLSHVLLRPDAARSEIGRAERATATPRGTDQRPAKPPRSVPANAPAKPATVTGATKPPVASPSRPVATGSAAPAVAVPPPLPVVPTSAPDAPAQTPVSDTTLHFRTADLKLPVEQPPSDLAVSAALGALRPTFADEAVPAQQTAPTPAPALPAGPPVVSPPARVEAVKDPSRMAEQRRVEQILHKLAAQIKSGAVRPRVEPVAETPEPAAANAAAVPEPMVATEPTSEAATDSALAKAVNTLLSTVEAMRGGIRGAPPVARAPSQAEVRLAAVAEALDAERTDVYLQPILALKDDTASHFEVSVRLRTEDGLSLDRDQVTYDVRGAGLLPLLDAIGVRHSADFALKLERKGRVGSVFSQIGGESLENPGFVNGVAARNAQGVADRLVLSFDQEDIRGLGIVQLGALAELKRQGFRFAIERLAHLDMDFEKLQIAGFAFIKLDPAVFTHGLGIDSSTVPAGDLCRFFRDYGLDVIVGRIEHEAERQSMISHGVLFGQGTLFGDPRVIPVGPLSPGDVAAA